MVLKRLSEPADVFHFAGEKLGIMDFKNIRVQAERQAREKTLASSGHTEVTLEETWHELEIDVGTDPKIGMNAEVYAEKSLCYANPYMLKVWNALKEKGKRIIIISDMYLSAEVLNDILIRNGFEGAEKIYVSCEYKKNKAKGDLFALVKNELGDASVIHVGDNPVSDVQNAERNGFAVCRYPDAKRNMLLYRPYDMSSIVGGAYRGIVSNFIYNGDSVFSKGYEYGFIYGGHFVLGYCNFIREQAKRLGADKLLFLSRDGDTLIKAYDQLYPGEKTEYVYWSRKAALKLMAGFDKHDYFRRFIFHKVNQGYTVTDVLKSMELEFLLEKLNDNRKNRDEHTDVEIDKCNGSANTGEKVALANYQELCERGYKDLRPEDVLNEKNATILRNFIEYYWDDVIKSYAPQQTAAREYYEKVLDNCSKVLAVDIGWAGSGAMSLAYLAENAWNIPCKITGIIAGTNTMHNSEPDASESFLQSGKLISYMYSQSHNRDLLKKHDPGKGYNVFWELLLSSPEKPFTGFYPDGPHFGETDIDPDKALEIRTGIMDFIKEYTQRFKDYPYMMSISGRDAYAPVLAASGGNEKYLHSIEKLFDLKVNVD